MADEDYEVIITGEEHKVFLGYHSEIVKLEAELAKCKKVSAEKDDIIKKYEWQVKIKVEEVAFLESLIAELNNSR